MTAMPPDTLAALKASIKHWQENVAAETPHNASTQGEACALCHMFRRGKMENACAGCPVAEKTGTHNCRKSPWGVANFVKWAWYDNPDNPGAAAAWRFAAQAELDFLISLLPEGETP